MTNPKILAPIMAMFAASAMAQVTTINEQVSFDCSGSLTRVQDVQGNGRTATGAVTLDIERADGSTLVSGGLIFISLPGNQSREINQKITRCTGEGYLIITQTFTVKGLPVYELRIVPSRIRMRAGNRKINEPGAVGFMSTGSGNPTV